MHLDKEAFERFVQLTGNDRFSPFLTRIYKCCPSEVNEIIKEAWRLIKTPAVVVKPEVLVLCERMRSSGHFSASWRRPGPGVGRGLCH